MTKLVDLMEVQVWPGGPTITKLDQSPEDLPRNLVRFHFEQRAKITNVDERLRLFVGGIFGSLHRRMADRDSAELIEQSTDEWVETFLDGVQDVLTVAAIANDPGQRTNALRQTLSNLASVLAEWAIDNERTTP